MHILEDDEQLRQLWFDDEHSEQIVYSQGLLQLAVKWSLNA